MKNEFQALEENNTWEVTSLLYGKNAVGSRWVYKIKRKSDGTVDRYKARLAAKGFTQLEGMDYHETFSPIAKMTKVRTVLAVANLKGWPLYQLDVNNAFLHGTLDEEVYMEIPPGFYIADRTNGKVLRLLKSIYGLKQASRQWFEKFSETLLQYGFQASLNDYSLFTFSTAKDFVALLVYVDYVIITGTSTILVNDIKKFIHSKFKIKDLGHLHYLLGVEVARLDKGLFINQRKYALDIISEAGLNACKPVTTPLES